MSLCGERQQEWRGRESNARGADAGADSGHPESEQASPARGRARAGRPQSRRSSDPTREAVEQARIAFTRKWQLRCEAVSSGFAEAGDELLHLYPFPDVAVEGAAHH